MARPRKQDDSCRTAHDKCDSIVIAARQIFEEIGYAAASMDAVALRADVSKATIYAYFANKQALFEHVVRMRCRSLAERDELPLSAGDGKSLLRQLAERRFAEIHAPQTLALTRMVIAESIRQPDLGQSYHAACSRPPEARLAAALEAMVERELLAIPRTEIAAVAELFHNMVQGDGFLRGLLGLPPGGGDPARLIDLAVDLV